MLKARKKITKRELKEDTIVTGYFKVVGWYEEYKRYVLWGVAGIALLVLAVVVYSNNRRNADQRASTALGQIISIYDRGDYGLALSGIPEQNVMGLQAIVDNYGGSRSGDLARLYAANCYLYLGEADKALKLYEDFGGPDKAMQAARMAGEAGCYEMKKNYKEAAEALLKAAGKDPKGVNAANHLLRAGIDYKLAGDKEKALELFRKLKQEYPKAEETRRVDFYIGELGA
jgi:tetratricopeptide (TPR) repeat protein